MGSDDYRRRWLYWLAWQQQPPLGALTVRAQQALQNGEPVRRAYAELRAAFAEVGYRRTCANPACQRRFPVASGRDDKTHCSAACRQAMYAARKAAAAATAMAKPQTSQPSAVTERARVVRWGGGIDGSSAW